jgi:hypothetical protein
MARLAIADHVAAGPRSVSELARETGVDASALYRVLRALSSLGVFALDGDAVRNTELSELLRSDAPASMRWHAIMFMEEHYGAWSNAYEAVRTGQPSFERLYGAPHFQWLAANPDAADTFNRAMAGGAVARAHLLAGYDWSGVATVVDVGGGTGRLLASVLCAHPHLHGVVFDLPHSRVEAEATIAASGLDARLSFEEGSFFERVPAGADAYLLSQIIHDWDDAEATAILRRCRAAATNGARLLVVDNVIDAGNGPQWAKLLDLHMLVMLGGRERTEAEWRGLLAAGGYSLEQITTGPVASLLEATPDGGAPESASLASARGSD